MGYTHYWSTSTAATKPQRAAIAAAVGRALYIGAKMGRFEVDGQDDQPVICTSEEIFFNGKGKMGHETFVFDYEAEDFDFCKTASKPYDLAVTAALVIAKVIMGSAISIRSDGDDTDWVNGIELAQLALGQDIGFKLDTRS